jgi:hypothetical protein
MVNADYDSKRRIKATARNRLLDEKGNYHSEKAVSRQPRKKCANQPRHIEAWKLLVPEFLQYPQGSI